MSFNDKIEKSFKSIAAAAAVIVGIFHILNVSGAVALSAMTVRAFHVMIMFLIVFLKPDKGKKNQNRAVGNLLKIIGASLTLFSGVYILARWENITSSGGVTNRFDVIVGIMTVALVLEATRRSVGIVLSLITCAFLAYPFIGPYLPWIFKNKGYSVNRIFAFLYTTTEGVYGIPISVSATYIVLFCIYGSFLSEFGAGEFLYKLSLSLTRKFVAATAKTSIIFSALIGMISGSAAGNVAITGTLTIPMMIKEGYEPEKAGAISAVAATGGQIMPPVMGAAAFIMAEIVGVSYAKIMKAAILPALLYFLSIFIIVELEAKKKGMRANKDRDADVTFAKTIKEGWYYVIPIMALIFMLVIGYSPFKSAFYSIVALLAVFIVSKKTINLDTIKKISTALKKGSFDTVSIATACASSGIIVGVLSITGLGSKLSTLIIQLSNGSLIIALILTMIVSLILGMGLPTTAAYLVLASVVVPALVKMGAPILTAHMFVFFFGCISTITPPVALASYVAAGIANSDLNKVGWTAFKYGLVSFILPYLFVYGPSLLLEGTIFTIITTVILSIIGIYAVAASIVGFFKVNLKLWQRIVLFAAGILLVSEGYITGTIGIALIIVVYLTISLMKKNQDNTLSEVLK